MTLTRSHVVQGKGQTHLFLYLRKWHVRWHIWYFKGSKRHEL